MLTCAGRAFAARMAASLLHAVGLPELVTHSLDDYERLAIALAADPQQAQQLKARLAANRDSCPLFDTPAFVRHLEYGLSQAHQRQEQGLPPAAIDALSPGPDV